MPLSFQRRSLLRTATLLFFLLVHGELFAQISPQEVSFGQTVSFPFYNSGRLNVTFGDQAYFGTATMIHWFTGLTAAHLLYDPETGFGKQLYYQPEFIGASNTQQRQASFFAVLSGYQDAAHVDPNSNPAFEHDMGYVLYVVPEYHDRWAAFGANTAALTTATQFLVIGYAGETFSGDQMASVDTSTPFYELLGPALFENTSYYTQGGMSGGPLYVPNGGSMQLVAETVAGTDPPAPAQSVVRAITDDEVTLLTEAEYVHGIVTSGKITGPAVVAAGAKARYTTDLIFIKGAKTGGAVPRYDELALRVRGHRRKQVSVTKLKAGRFEIAFDASLPSGTLIVLELIRTTGPASQTPLQSETVGIQ